MSVPIRGTGKTIKHFDAMCPVSQIAVASAHTTASSRTAASFLEDVIQRLPVTLKSIQVDGGSEFMKEFEKACESKGIELYVLPPRSPKLKGCVERCNRTLRYEFYRLYKGSASVADIDEALQEYMNIYNTERPHEGLNMVTPMAYYDSIKSEAFLSQNI